MSTRTWQAIDELNSRSWVLAPTDPREALALAEHAVDEAQTLRYSYGRAVAHLNCGWAHVYLGSYDDALTRIYEARATFDSIHDQIGQIQTLNALGVVSHRIGEREQARAYYRESLRLADESNEAHRRLAALNNLGELACETGDLDSAQELLEQARALAEELDEAQVIATVTVNRGVVALMQGCVADARDLLVDGIERTRACGDRIAESNALCFLGDATDVFDEAIELYRQSVQICSETGHREGLVRALGRLGSKCRAIGRLADAERYLMDALADATTPEWWRMIVEPLEALAAEFESTGDQAATIRIYRSLSSAHQAHAADTGARRVATLRHYHQLEQSRVETVLARARNEELQSRFDRLAAENSMLQLIYAIGREVTATLEMGEIAQRLYRALNEIMSADVFGVALYDDERRVLDYSYVIEQNQRITPFSVSVDSDASFGSWTVRNRKEIVLNDSKHEYEAYITKHRPFSAADSLSIVYTPLLYEDRIEGVVTVQSYRKAAYSDDHVDLLRMLAPYLAIAVDNSRKMETIRRLNDQLQSDKQELEQAYRQINHMANHDNLTGLPNRRLLVELIEGHIPLARRNGECFGVLYLDLDQFKPINDTYGHRKGDEVLVEIAARLRSVVRESDSVARLGGDEFVLVVRNVAGPEALVQVAEKIRHAVCRPFVVEANTHELSVSIGASLFPLHGEDCDALLSAADGAMYASKRSSDSAVSFAVAGGG